VTASALLQQFHFLRPLWLAALIPLWALLAWQARRRVGQGSWARLIDADLLPALRLQADRPLSSASPMPWLSLAWTLAVLALAGPSWQHDVTAAFRGARAWVIVLDLSPSMSASDLSPDRITRARYAIDDLLGAAHDARIGLVAFSDESYVVAPLTDDVATIRALLPPLTPDIMPGRGDNLAPALRQAGTLLRAVAAREQRVIVLSDGFVDPAASLAAAAALKTQGVIVDVIGIGTRGGAPVAGDHGGFARDASGQTQLSRLDPDRLQGVADAGGGRYVDLQDLASLVARLDAESTAGISDAAQDVHIDHWRDGGVWLLPFLLVLTAALSRRGWL